MAHTKKITRTEIKEKFLGEEYPIHVVGRHIEVTDAMKSYALDKLTRIDKFGGRVIDAWVVMDLQRGIHMVDFLINVNNKKILCSGRDKDMYASIDMAIEHLKNKLSRYHKQLHELNRTKIGYTIHPGETGINPLDDINDMIEEETLKHIEQDFRPHPIVKREKMPLKLLTEEEALWKMETTAETCLIYRAEEDEKVKVIYRLHDGNYGITEAE